MGKEKPALELILPSPLSEDSLLKINEFFKLTSHEFNGKFVKILVDDVLSLPNIPDERDILQKKESTLIAQGILKLDNGTPTLITPEPEGLESPPPINILETLTLFFQKRIQQVSETDVLSN